MIDTQKRRVYNCLEAIKRRSKDPVIQTKVNTAKIYLEYDADKKKGLQEVIRISALACGVNEGQIRTKSRKKELVLARALCYYYLRYSYGYTLQRIGDLFNNRGHDSVLHSINQLKNYMEVKDVTVTDAVNKFNNLINRTND